MSGDDIFWADGAQDVELAAKEPWTVLIVDDEDDVHDVTRYALAEALFDERPMRFLSARSASEAKTILAAEPDVGVILLDVVMETESAGLDLIPYIRNEMNNRAVRIVLRTGQPGQAPERDVVVQYDIHDYKTKAELTSAKLFTCLMSSLRSYRDIRQIERNKQGLERIIGAAPHIFKHQSFDLFATAVLHQVSYLLGKHDSVYALYDGLTARCEGQQYKIVAATGRYQELIGRDANEVLPPNILSDFGTAAQTGKNLLNENRLTAIFGAEESTALLHLDALRGNDESDLRLVDVFTRNISVAFHNLLLRDDIEETQRDIVIFLSETVETRSKETGNHVRRMARYSRLLAELSGCDSFQCDLIENAAPLHDIGKIGIPDAILNKPGRHTPEESVIMRTHARMGAEMLRNSRRAILRAGAIIAAEHHEKWDGTGYPEGKKGAEIHFFGRVCALADVYDALMTPRCYKPAWTLEATMDLIRQESGRHFDPALVEVLIENLDRFLAVQSEFPEP